MVYKSLPDRKFTTAMIAATMMKNKRWKWHKGHSNHARSSRQEADYSAQREYYWPIHSQNVITEKYERDDDNDNDDNDE